MSEQRQLTQEELNLAHSLEWNPTDFIAKGSSIIFENKRNYQVLYPDGKLGALMSRPSNAFNAQPIPRKAFDIDNHEFSDSDVSDVRVSDVVCIDTGYDKTVTLTLNKADAIAIAKALGVKPEDFK